MATYNERENLGPLIRAIHEVVPAADILVIDDNSPDGTGRLADELARADPRVRVLHRPGKLGLGTAILTGMHFAIAHGYDLFLTMDADFSHHPRYLPAILAGLQGDDVIIGSQYVPGGGTVNWPWSRRLGLDSLLATHLSRILESVCTTLGWKFALPAKNLFFASDFRPPTRYITMAGIH